VWAPIIGVLLVLALVYGFGLGVVLVVWWQQRKERD
jgi:uncharacterized protein HemX